MKRLFLYLSLVFLLGVTTQAQYTIPDPAFAAKLQQIVPNAMNGNVLDTNHLDVTSLTYMDLSYSSIVTMDGLRFFTGLEDLWCPESWVLTTIPELPSTLKTLHAFFCYQLNSIPLSFPSALEELTLAWTDLSTIPALPSSLNYLDISNSGLNYLPALPSGLQHLNCAGNQLTSLPVLPVYLDFLNCSNNQLTSLPALTNYMWELQCQNNDISCLPQLPNSLSSLVTNGNPLFCIPNIPSSSNFNLVPTLPVCSPGTCFPDEYISGRVFTDVNGNGQKDPTEGSFFLAAVEATPGNFLSGVNSLGYFGLAVDSGSYVVQGRPLQYHTITTQAHLVTIPSGGSDTSSLIGYQPIPGIYDLVAQVSADVTRPGFDNNVYLQVKNIGTEATSASFSFDFDAVQTWVSANNTPVMQSGSNATWNLSMQPGDCWSATVTLNTPPNVALLGTPVQHVLNATPGNADNTPADNTFTFNDVIVGAYDPNDKLSSVPSIVESEVQSGTTVDYTIRFQNTGTFLAENVLITDTLPQELQAGTFSFLASSHPHYWYIENDVLHIRYDGIQLPDSTSDEPGSHGFFKFRIAPETSLVESDSIVNVANIYFDFNEPVITEPNVVHIEGEGLLLQAQVFLGGCYDQSSGLMRDDLRTAGLIPLTEPYTAMGYVSTGTQPNGTIDANVLQTTGNDAVVDWIIVELRDATNNTQTLASRFGLLQRDGDIVDIDGVSPLSFQAPADDYFVAIRHRNHLGVMSGLSYSLSTTPTTVGFINTQTPTYGSDAQQDLSGTTVLWSGNVNGDSVLKYTGTTNDRDIILQVIGGNVPTATIAGYHAADVNMDGVVKYAGTANDRDIILVNIGGNVPTATRVEQLP